MIKALWSKEDRKWKVFQIDECPWFSASDAILKNCLFYIDQDSRELIQRRAIDYGEFTARYPHAAVFAQGVLPVKPTGEWKEFSYNPFKYDHFYLIEDHEKSVHYGEYVHLRPDGHGEVILKE